MQEKHHVNLVLLVPAIGSVYPISFSFVFIVFLNKHDYSDYKPPAAKEASKWFSQKTTKS